MRIVIVSFCVLFLSACYMESQDAYVQQVQKDRYSKDSVFRFSTESPIPPQYKTNFVSLLYYEPDERYRVMSTYTPLDTPQYVRLNSNFNMVEEYYKVGTVSFHLLGQDFKLSVLQRPELMTNETYKNTLFMPFYDATNGEETYKNGRYMDLLRKEGESTIEIDFNYAYNPYCAYTTTYTCPFPPSENRLPLKVEAGEKKMQ